ARMGPRRRGRHGSNRHPPPPDRDRRRPAGARSDRPPSSSSSLRGARMSAIEAVSVSKAFWIPHEQRARLKEYFAHPFKRVAYERNDALQDVTFAVTEGEFFGIVGPNGSGKSTLLKVLAGIYRADRATVRIGGRCAGASQ